MNGTTSKDAYNIKIKRARDVRGVVVEDSFSIAKVLINVACKI
jgi:hypothetical protein